MVELRKRKAPPAPPPPPPAKKKSTGSAKAKAPAPTEPVVAPANGDSPSDSGPAVGSTIDLANFGGEVETNEGTKTTLAQLVADSEAGIVIFTYPKASTPGCTQQACLFRNAYSPLTASGLRIYGLSADSPKANTTFRAKQDLPYPLLCDTSSQALIAPLGFQKHPRGTKRGVFVVAKGGRVLAHEPGGPQATVDAVRRVVEEMRKEAGPGSAPAAATATAAAAVAAAAAEKSDEVTEKVEIKDPAARTADEVADTAAKLDREMQNAPASVPAAGVSPAEIKA